MCQKRSAFWSASEDEPSLGLSKIRKAFPTSESEQTASLETDVAGLQARLMQSSNATEREQLLDKLVEYERRLGLAWTKGDAANTRLPVQPAPLTNRAG